jgi:hypothetical protein
MSWVCDCVALLPTQASTEKIRADVVKLRVPDWNWVGNASCWEHFSKVIDIAEWSWKMLLVLGIAGLLRGDTGEIRIVSWFWSTFKVGSERDGESSGSQRQHRDRETHGVHGGLDCWMKDLYKPSRTLGLGS